MNICTGTTTWSKFFSLSEILLMSGLIILYFKSIWNLIIHNEKDFYEKLDLLVIFLSSIQLVLFFIMLIFEEYFIASLIISILRFSENAIICCLLLVIIMWKHYTVTHVIVNYFMMFILVFDISCFLVGIFAYKPFNTDYCKPILILLFILLGFILDIAAIVSGIYLKITDKDEESVNEAITQGDQFYINNMFNKYIESMRQMMKSYLIIALVFFISFSIDLVFQLILKRKEEVIGNDNATNAIDGKVFSTINPIESHCDYYGLFGSEFSMKQYLICFISYCFRDIIPHLCIYLFIMVYKPSNLSRSASFIEIL